jgi:MFS family permease
MAPATARIMSEFHSTDDLLAGFVTSVQLLGYVCGPLVIAPLSELYGRNPVYHCCNVIFLVFNIACAKAPNLASLIVFRLIAGIGASCPVTIGAGTIADIISREKRGLAMSSWIIGPLLGPTTGPISMFSFSADIPVI